MGYIVLVLWFTVTTALVDYVEFGSIGEYIKFYAWSILVIYLSYYLFILRSYSNIQLTIQSSVFRRAPVHLSASLHNRPPHYIAHDRCRLTTQVASTSAFVPSLSLPRFI